MPGGAPFKGIRHFKHHLFLEMAAHDLKTYRHMIGVEATGQGHCKRTSKGSSSSSIKLTFRLFTSSNGLGIPDFFDSVH